jgi:hypothetical protein
MVISWKRIAELDDPTKPFKTELSRFEVNDGDHSCDIGSNGQNNPNNIERLAKGLTNKPKTDHQAVT